MPGRLDPEPIARRDFLGLAGLWAAFLAIGGSVVGMLRLPKPRVTPEASSVVRIGKAEDFPPGTSRVMLEHRIRVFSSSEGIAAVSLICTHLGCIVKETADGFSCPCHGSKFALDGKVIKGPAPRALNWLACARAADGTLLVDTSRDVKTGTYYKA
ncbi:MAG: Rieske 2Fe-2S domain-containing protein [Verrucomicrobia bacterium]|nr:Rieske 2Fe-2S domain-containing protein [Verrucomicrobiota bacterium]MDA1086563.1 Rieske 2Fe-2S domain-containing protein [Verrucomicrobiota bacterium]